MKAWWCPISFALCCAACSLQGEGDRCDPLNGDQDCESGLVCVTNSELSQLGEGALCCPPVGEARNVEACNPLIPFLDDEPDETPSAQDAGN